MAQENAAQRQPGRLGMAARMRNLPWMKRLLDEGADASERLPQGAGRDPECVFTPLMHLLSADPGPYWTTIDGIRMLVQAGADVNFLSPTGETPLSIAARCSLTAAAKDSFQVLKELLDQGANPYLGSDEAKQVLRQATERLRTRGFAISLSANETKADATGLSPVMLEALDRSPADWEKMPGRMHFNGQEFEHGPMSIPSFEALRNRGLLEYRDATNRELLETAWEWRRTGAGNEIAAQFALAHRVRRGKLEAIQSLLAAGADPGVTIPTRGGSHASVLMESIGTRHAFWPYRDYYAAAGGIEVVQALLDAGADVNYVSQRGGTALTTVARFIKHEATAADLLRRLLAAGADPDLGSPEKVAKLKRRMAELGVGPARPAEELETEDEAETDDPSP